MLLPRPAVGATAGHGRHRAPRPAHRGTVPRPRAPGTRQWPCSRSPPALPSEAFNARLSGQNTQSPQIMCPGRQAATTLGQNLCLCRKRILQPKNARPLDDAAFTPTSQSVHKLASPFRRRRTRRQGGSRRAPPATLRARCRRAVARPPQPREAWWRAGRGRLEPSAVSCRCFTATSPRRSPQAACAPPRSPANSGAVSPPPHLPPRRSALVDFPSARPPRPQRHSTSGPAARAH